MPTDIVSPHNNVISFQIRPRQDGQAAGQGDARFACISHPAARNGGRLGSLVWSVKPWGKADRQNSVALEKKNQVKESGFAGSGIHLLPTHPSIHPSDKCLSDIYLGAKPCSSRCNQVRDLPQPASSRTAPRKRWNPWGWEISLGNQFGKTVPSKERAWARWPRWAGT